jgi:hypothetical protein
MAPRSIFAADFRRFFARLFGKFPTAFSVGFAADFRLISLGFSADFRRFSERIFRSILGRIPDILSLILPQVPDKFSIGFSVNFQ